MKCAPGVTPYLETITIQSTEIIEVDYNKSYNSFHFLDFPDVLLLV